MGLIWKSFDFGEPHILLIPHILNLEIPPKASHVALQRVSRPPLIITCAPNQSPGTAATGEQEDDHRGDFRPEALIALL